MQGFEPYSRKQAKDSAILHSLSAATMKTTQRPRKPRSYLQSEQGGRTATVLCCTARFEPTQLSPQRAIGFLRRDFCQYPRSKTGDSATMHGPSEATTEIAERPRWDQPILKAADIPFPCFLLVENTMMNTTTKSTTDKALA